MIDHLRHWGRLWEDRLGVKGVVEGLHYWGKFARENVHMRTRACTHTAGLINGRAVTSLRLSATIAPSRRRRIRTEIPGSGQTARGDIDRERGEGQCFIAAVI